MLNASDVRCAVAAFCLGIVGSSGFAQSNSNATMLIPELGLSAVCYSSPYEAGWDETVESHRYILLVKDADQLSAQRVYVQNPVQYRLLVKGFPCYYSYQSFRYTGMGTALNTTFEPSDPVIIDGQAYPAAFSFEVLEPIVRTLIADCKEAGWGSFPWVTEIQSSCNDQVVATLVDETTSVRIANDPNDPNMSQRQIFVHGWPLHNGESIKHDYTD